MSSNETILDWSYARNFQFKRRRAGVVCTSCHIKKIRCDLEECQGKGRNTCSACTTSGSDCLMRHSRRLKTHDRNSSPTAVSATPYSNSFPSLSASFESSTARAIPQSANTAIITPATIDVPQTPHPQNEQLAPCEFRALSTSSTTAEIVDTVGSTTTTAAMAESHDGDVDTGFLQVFATEHINDTRLQTIIFANVPHNNLKSLQANILHVFVETYFDYCYTWCPVLDRSSVFTELAKSPLLSNALAVAGSHIRPPLNSLDSPADYYNHARQLFNDDQETDAIITLKSLLLFYWWAPRSSSAVHRHSSWFWTSVVIRQGHQMNLHRQPTPNQLKKSRVEIGIRRRIWWTAFARERLTALCQSKPPIINLKDCTLGMPTLADFPSDGQDQKKAEVFIEWVRLCDILGKIAKYLSRTSPNETQRTAFPQDISNELIAWVRALPPHLNLPISLNYTPNFDRDVHQLHLPYLAAIIVLHLEKSSGLVPNALPPAILAASCMARIFSDILARSDTRFLTATSSWYSGISFITLLNASSHEYLAKAAEADLDTITLIADRLRRMWASSNVIYEGFGRLRAQANKVTAMSEGTNLDSLWSPDQRRTTNKSDRSSWMNYFPFISSETSGIANLLLAVEDSAHSGYADVQQHASSNLQDWFGIFQDDSLTDSGAFAF